MRERTQNLIRSFALLISVLPGLCYFPGCRSGNPTEPQNIVGPESREQYDARMEWWNEARFGLFLHWGLFAVPGGVWNGRVYPVDWIRALAEIPLVEYEAFMAQFNPVRFSPADWVRIAKDAGMKYVVLTTKHHDGFCLFESKATTFDIMATPFGRDVARELAEACRAQGLRICWYYSIMDWHHQDYLPRLPWETDRPVDSADFERYNTYVKNQVKELLTNYGDISVFWFDGEWESYWSRQRGLDLYQYIRSLNPNILINDRFAAPRRGFNGFTPRGEIVGDFGTSERIMPEAPAPGTYWELCMPLNEEWGYSKVNPNWLSTKQVIGILAEVASKGGNFLLDVGPTDQGEFPQPAIDRLKQVGAWMRVNGESIYGTSAGPIAQPSWGFCTQKRIGTVTRLYLHVTAWPGGGTLRVRGLNGTPVKAWALSDPAKTALPCRHDEDALVIDIPTTAPDMFCSVIALDFPGNADAVRPPVITADQPIFIDALDVGITSSNADVEIRYSLDGQIPTLQSPVVVDRNVHITETSTVVARCFRNGQPVSDTTTRVYRKVIPIPATQITGLVNGLDYAYYEGEWDILPEFSTMTPLRTGTANMFTLIRPFAKQHFGFEFRGYINVPVDAAYTFLLYSDDGSKLFIDDRLIIDNDSAHTAREYAGAVALKAGYHRIRIPYFERTGEEVLIVQWHGGTVPKQEIQASVLFREP